MKLNRMQKRISEELLSLIKEDLAVITPDDDLGEINAPVKINKFVIQNLNLIYKIAYQDYAFTYEIQNGCIVHQYTHNGKTVKLHDDFHLHSTDDYDEYFGELLTKEFAINFAKMVQKELDKSLAEEQDLEEERKHKRWIQNMGAKFYDHKFNLVFKDGTKLKTDCIGFGIALMYALNLKVHRDYNSYGDSYDPASGWTIEERADFNYVIGKHNKYIRDKYYHKIISFPTNDNTGRDYASSDQSLVELLIALNIDPEKILKQKAIKLNINPPAKLMDKELKMWDKLPDDGHSNGYTRIEGTIDQKGIDQL